MKTTETAHIHGHLDFQCVICLQAKIAAKQVLEEYAELFIELQIPQSSCAAVAVLGEELSRIEDEHLAKQMTNISIFKPLFKLLCANKINETVALIMDGRKSQPEQRFEAHLLGMWQGMLLAVQWMDEDGVLSLFKDLHRRELAVRDRRLRDEKQAKETAKLLKLLQRNIKNSDKSLMRCTKQILASEKHSKLITINSLIIACLEPQITQAVENSRAEWANGEEASHAAMAGYMVEDLFATLDTESRKIAKDEIMARLNELSKEQYPERHFGDKGIRKNG